MINSSLQENEWPGQASYSDPYRFPDPIPNNKPYPPEIQLPSQAHSSLVPSTMPVQAPVLMPMTLPMPLHMPVPMLAPEAIPVPTRNLIQTYDGYRPMPVNIPVPPYIPVPPKQDNPRELRNKAEKQRRDKMNRSIAELASIVPQVVAANRKIDKTSVLRLSAHCLRNDYVYGCPTGAANFGAASVQALLRLFKGFLLSVTYKGLVVTVSQNVNEFLGYTELELLGQNLFTMVHKEDHHILREQLLPGPHMFGQHGELLVPDDEADKLKMAESLVKDHRNFFIRIKKLGQRSEPSKYVTCHVEGSFKISDHAYRGKNRGCQVLRRVRARGNNPCSSGNDVVFIGIVRPSTETFINESALEEYKMEYRTRHSIDGEIIECEQRIALVTGYMTSEVNGVNAMNFIHRNEVRWVILALKEMYYNSELYGESCYRLLMRNGQFVYMRTRGVLDVDPSSRVVTSLVCTNTVVGDDEGRYLVQMMKEKINLNAHSNGDAVQEDVQNATGSESVVDPRNLEEEILNMVTNLPSPQANTDSPVNETAASWPSPSRRLAIIAPEKERIVNAIEKIYTVIQQIPNQSTLHEYQSPPNMQTDISALETNDGMEYSNTTESNSERFNNISLSDFGYDTTLSNLQYTEFNEVTPQISKGKDGYVFFRK